MKKLKQKNLIIATSVVFLSAIVSVAISVPIGKNVYFQSHQKQLSAYSDEKANAKSFDLSKSENQQEILQTINQINLKQEFQDSLTAQNAVDLYFDKSYSFDLNSLVDFSPLLAKFPGFSFKLLIPDKKTDIKINNNSLSNLAINVQNQEKNIDYNVNFALKFSNIVKNSEIDPANVVTVLELLNTELIKNKTASEVAILFNQKFLENKAKSPTDKAALVKTIAEFGSLSFFNKDKTQLILPLTFDLEPSLKDNKIFFSKVDDASGQANLDLNLVDKFSKKKSKIALEFKNLSTINESYANKFAEIFKKNYQFNDEVAKFLASSNLSPTDLISKTLPDSVKNNQIFRENQPNSLNFWFKQSGNSILESDSTTKPLNVSAQLNFSDKNKQQTESSESDGSTGDNSGNSNNNQNQNGTVKNNQQTESSEKQKPNNAENNGASEESSSQKIDNKSNSKTEKQEQETTKQVPKIQQEFAKILPNFKISSFKIEPVIQKLDAETEKDLIKKQQIPLKLTLTGNFSSGDSFPGGLNFNSEKQLEYSFNFNFDVSDKVYGAYFQNALDSIVKSESGKASELKIENLEFQINDKQPVAIFARTIDQTIEHIKSKKIQLAKIKTEAKQLFDLLDFVAKTKSQEKPEDSPSSQSETAKVSVSTKASQFQETETTQTQQEISSTEVPTPGKQTETPGKLLSSVFDNLLESKLPESTSVILDSNFKDGKYNLLIGIWVGDSKLKEVEIPIINVVKDNKPYELLQEETKVHFFLDGESLVKQAKGAKEKQQNINQKLEYIESIKAINSDKIKLIPSKDADNKPERGEPIKPFINKKDKGIYLTNDGLEIGIEEIQKSQPIKNPTIILAFKSQGNFSLESNPFFLIQGLKEKTFKADEEKKYGQPPQKIDFSIRIRRYHYIEKINDIEARIGDEEKSGENSTSINHHTALVENVVEITEKQKFGRYERTFKRVQKVDESKNNYVKFSDFLDNKNVNSMIVFSLIDAENKKNKMKLSFYSSAASDPYEPVWTKTKIVDINSFKFSDLKHLILGKLNSSITSLDAGRPSGAIILKSAAIFESTNEEKSNEINKLFIDRYFELENKK
ncbi:P110/LppT family adhesin N-terminal domain [Mesomycoplasma dispar]|uniref:P102/LppT family protein n=1 Tax=Mesomycoplasma dispar TaxID=86660 RepID=A0ABM6PRC3_9BACT|nr:P110/LppT family adhesin N-terminal domain [Mesomycoplasma dispar]ATP59703.1 hypothetical protein CSW10_02020 [Mesomycoplasma dispar]